MAGKTDRGTLPTYQASAGDTVKLSFNFNSSSPAIFAGDLMAASIKGLDQTGVESGGIGGLTHATSPAGTTNWTDKSSTPDWWYTPSPYPSYTKGTTKSFDFYLSIGANAPADFYDLAFQVGGGPETWSAEQHFYLQILPAALIGDANGDGVIDATDYIALKTHMGQSSGATTADGDFNADGAVNWTDLQLLQANIGGTLAAVPEPTTVILLGLGGLAALRRKRKT